MIEGVSACEFGDAVGLYLVSDVVIPPKIKVSEFGKVQGSHLSKESFDNVLQKKWLLMLMMRSF